MENEEATFQDLFLSDTTLRDGEQMPGASLGPQEKLQIALALAEAGVQSIDAGFPACTRSEVEAIRLIAKHVQGPLITTLCRTLQGDIDLAYEALSEAHPMRRSVTLFVGTSPQHREHKLRKSEAQVLELIGESIRYAKRNFPIVIFTPEDASRTELPFLCDVYRAAISAGAMVVGFTDTLGVMTPESVRHTIRYLFDHVPELGQVRLGGHFHDDLGLATANSLAAVLEGVQVIQCTVNGIGERAGNASLEEVVLALTINQDHYRRKITVDPAKLTGLSRLVERLTGVPVSPNKAVVGSNIFSTEAGIHQDGIMKHLSTYLPFEPELVGGDGVRLVLGKHSGRSAIAARLKDLGLDLSPEQVSTVAELVREAPKAQWSDPDALLVRTVEAVRKDLSPTGATAE